MNKDQLIAKQQLSIENNKEIVEQNDQLKSRLHGKFFSIGAPLNDNVLQFNKEQQKWLMGVWDLIEQINTKEAEEEDEDDF